MLLIHSNLHWNWREACQINASQEKKLSLQNSSSNNLRAVPRDGVVGWTVTEEGTEPTCDQKHSTLEGNLLGNLKNGSQQSLGDAAGLPVFAKKRFHAAQAISPHTAKETNQEDFPQAGALRAKKPRQWRHNTQRLSVTLAWLHD